MKNSILVRGARQLVTLQGRSSPRRGGEMQDIGLIQDGSILITDGTIQRIGPSRQVENVAEARTAHEINAAGRVVLPAFVDAHTRLVAAPPRVTKAAERPESLDHAVQWVRNASPTVLESHARRYVEAAVRHGTLTTGSTSGYGLNAPAEMKILRVLAQIGEPRVCLVPSFGGALGRAPEFDDGAQYLAWLSAEILPKLRDRRLVRHVAAACEQSAFSSDELRPYLDAAARAGFPIELHGDRSARCGCARLGAEYGAISVAGLNAINDSDVNLLSRSATIAILFAGELIARDRITPPPARALLDGGAAVALASGFNPSLVSTFNMQAVIAIACEWMDFTVEEALTAATVNGAHALGRGGACGTLECGRDADFLILNVSDYREIPLHHGCNFVSLVMRRGRTIWQEGPLTCDVS